MKRADPPAGQYTGNKHRNVFREGQGKAASPRGVKVFRCRHRTWGVGKCKITAGEKVEKRATLNIEMTRLLEKGTSERRTVERMLSQGYDCITTVRCKRYAKNR